MGNRNNYERRYLHDKRLHVVSNKWLEDSVDKQMKLPETAYDLKPDTLEEIQIERSEENNQPSDDKHEEEEVETSHIKHIPRKRGRPASSSSRIVRPAHRPVRRRAGRGNQLAKLDDVESEGSGPGETGQDDQKLSTDCNSKMEEDNSCKDQGPPPAAPRPARRTNARRGNRRAKVDYCESEESNPGETGQGVGKLDTDSISKMEEDNLDENQEPPAGAQFVTLEEQEPRGLQMSTMETTSSPKYGSSFRGTNAAEATSTMGEKIEQMVDPLDAMLLDMIPSLKYSRREAASSDPPGRAANDPSWVGSSASNYRAPMQQAGSSASCSAILAPQAGSSVQPTRAPAPDPNTAAPKKKKVSYKEMADQLLKDW